MDIQNSPLVFEQVSFEVLARSHLLSFRTIPLQPLRLQKRCGTILRQKSVRKKLTKKKITKINAVTPAPPVSNPNPEQNPLRRPLGSPRPGFGENLFWGLGPEPGSAHLPAASTGICSNAAFPAVGPVVLIGFFFLTTNGTFESKDSCKDFPRKGRDWFHVQRRLLQKPAVNYKDFKAMSCPCNTRHL